MSSGGQLDLLGTSSSESFSGMVAVGIDTYGDYFAVADRRVNGVGLMVMATNGLLTPLRVRSRTKDVAGVGDHAWSAFRPMGDMGDLNLVIEVRSAALEMHHSGKGVAEDPALPALKALAAKIIPQL